MDNVFLTVFTPTYNRAHTLTRTYESLKNQSCKEFMWLIVDDGSQDNTREMVHGWQVQEKAFKIEYIYKENGGMHTAHNTAYENIHTQLNTCIDSDDCLAEDAVAKLKNKWLQIKADISGIPVYRTKNGEAGVCGAAMLGAHAMLKENFAALAKRFAATEGPFLTDEVNHSRYMVEYRKYKKQIKSIYFKYN